MTLNPGWVQLGVHGIRNTVSTCMWNQVQVQRATAIWMHCLSPYHFIQLHNHTINTQNPTSSNSTFTLPILKNSLHSITHVNVNVCVYGLISPWVQQTSQFTLLVLELSLIWSHVLWGEFSTFSAANAIHNFPIFTPPGIHHCWVGRGSMEWEVCPTLPHKTSCGNRTPDLLILSQTPYPLGHMLP